MKLRLAWQQIPHPMVTDILCATTLDGIVLDSEHSNFNPETLYACITLCVANRKYCFVRVANIDHTIRTYLDAGASGIILSTIESQEQAIKLRNICQYPPMGKRGQGLVRENMWGKNGHLLGKRKTILIGQIETKEGVSSLASIDQAGVFDSYLIGPYDLSASLGVVGQFDHLTYLEQIQNIEMTIPKDRLGYHIVKDVKNEYPRYKEYGVVALSMDTLAILDRMDDMEKLLNETNRHN